MVTVELVVLAVLLVGSVLTLLYWAAVGFHVLRTILTIPTARAGLTLPAPAAADAPRVCVFIPAHNEAGCIGQIARTLARQDYPPTRLSVVFVLDRCTDQTRATLEAAWADATGAASSHASLQIIELTSCPPGWVGKSHALWSAVTTSTGASSADLFLFVDADTTLDPGLIRATVGLMRERKVGILSLMSTLTHGRWFETLVQPAAAMELIRQYPIARANAAAGQPGRRAFANGQFILIRSELYRQIGGHEAIRESVLEDVELARRCEYAGAGAALLLSAGMLRCDMYDSYPSFQRGWRRILGESANRKPARLRRNAWRIRWTAVFWPVMSLAAVIIGAWRLNGPHEGAAGLALWLGSVALVCYFLTLAVVYRTGRTPIWAVFGFPIGSWMVSNILHAAAADLDEGRPTEWGGREYLRQKRE